MRNFDAIVVGLGAMGSAAAYQLASHGSNVLGLEKYTANHSNGSYHGKTRIIRTAYFEHPSYVPLVKRALELWFRLQTESETKLIEMTGGLMFGQPNGELVSGALRSAKQHGLPHEVLNAKEIVNRFPVFHPDKNEIAVYEKNAGILFPEECIKAQDKLAEKYGAELHFNEPALRWKAGSNMVEIKTESSTYTANSAVLAAGPWMPELVPELKLPLSCERQTLFWFTPRENTSLFSSDRMPIFMWQTHEANFFYGFPDLGDGVKAARHHGGQLSSPDHVNREVTNDDETVVRQFLKEHVPSANGRLLSSTTCIYTNTQDGHFIIDFHPTHRNIVVLSPCSGHGFKFSSSIGEVARHMIQDGTSDPDISFFRIKRFTDATEP